MMRQRLAAVVLLMPFLFSVTPAWADGPAADVAAGAAVFDGEGRMPMFSCEPSESADDDCKGTWDGMFTATLSGRHTRSDGQEVPWTAYIHAPGAASLEYPAPDEASTCAAGPVRGHATFGGGGGGSDAFGAYANSSLLPAPIVNTKVSLTFEWHRQATAGPLVVTEMSIEFRVIGVGWVTVVDDSRSVSVTDAAATFVADEPLDCVTQAPATLVGAIKGTLSGIAVSTA